MSAAARLVALLIVAAPATAATEFDAWIDRELEPYVLDTLTTHPRFKGERVRFVVFDGDETAASASRLALRIRDRLVNAAVEAGGIRISFGQSPAPPGEARFDCTRGDAHYEIGVAIVPRDGGRFEFTLRARDLEERRLVPGFGLSWQGYLEPHERRRASDTRKDATLLGERGAPFEADQSDLLAAHLAHLLACAAARQTRGPYVVPQDIEPGGDDVFGGTLELIGKNVANHPAFDLATTANEANVALSGKAHRIDGSLHQYWLTLTPKNASSDIEALSVSAYVSVPGNRHEAQRDHGPVVAARLRNAAVFVPQSDEPLLGAFRLKPSPHGQRCPGPEASVRDARFGNGPSACALIEAKAAADAIVFVLAHRPLTGLARIDGGDCRRRTRPTLVRKHRTLSFAVPWIPDDATRVRDVTTWQTEPGGVVYYAVVVTDAAQARRVANHVDRLPQRCGPDRHRGIRYGELEQWLAGLTAIVARSPGHIDWRAIELKRVY